MEKREEGLLYVVGLPIGNLKDITLRAIEVLNTVDLILSEDTRSFLKLQRALKLKAVKVESFYREVEREKEERILSLLKEGKRIALCSEAGTPLLSDPGSSLVRRALSEGIRVVPVPGPSALTTALSACGTDLSEGFVFLGFLPKKEKEIREKLADLPQRLPLVLFIPPHRFLATIKALYQILGEREVCLARELTKVHEEICRTTLSQLLARAEEAELKGEITLIIEGRKDPGEREALSPAEVIKLYRKYQKTGLKKRAIAQRIAREVGMKAKDVYEIIKDL